MSRLRAWATDARGPKAIAVIRAAIGGIFVSEGLQKFLFSDDLGVGRFIKIGIPFPTIAAPFVGVVEILFGALLVLGLATRAVCVPLLFNMFVAITSTKLVTLGKTGLWKTLHEARTDVLMIAGLIFLVAVGSGSLSVDAKLHTPRRAGDG